MWFNLLQTVTMVFGVMTLVMQPAVQFFDDAVRHTVKEESAMIFYILCGTILLASLLTLLRYFKLRKVRRQREGEDFTRENFIDSFRPLGVPDAIPATVFDHYTSHGVWKEFPLSPDDTYSKVLTDDPEDIESDARVLVERLGMLFLPEYVRREYGAKPFVTVRDMVLWLDWIRQHQPAKS
jgi:hypothetical protein